MKARVRSNLLTSLAVCIMAMIFGASCFVQYCAAAEDISDEVIVTLHKHRVLTGVDGDQVAKRHRGALSKKVTNHADTVLLKKDKNVSMEEFLNKLKADGDVLEAVPNVIVRVPNPTPDKVYSAGEVQNLLSVQSAPSDPNLTWGYHDIEADMVTPCSDSAPLVAVIDTGVDYTHPELAGRVILGHDFQNGDDNPMDDHGHGTHVSGIIAAAANNGLGSAGVCSKARILALKALDSTGSGSLYNIIQAVYAAADNTDVRVINMSLGSDFAPSTFHDAIDYAVAHGKLVVAAAGNSNSNYPFFPALWSQGPKGGVLAVAANDQTNCKASFSNYGFWVSISAPGVGILSTLPNNSYGSWSGTSMATPFVSGAVARLLSQAPSLQPNDLVYLITSNGDPNLFNNTCWPSDSAPYPFEGRTSSFNHLDLSSAVAALPGGTPVAAPTVELLSPTTGSHYTTNNPAVNLSGLVKSEAQVAKVTWNNSRGGTGTANGTSSWTINSLGLYEGDNSFTITAVDSLGNQGSDTLVVNYAPLPGTTSTLNLQVSTKQDDASETTPGGSSAFNQGSSYAGKGRILGYHFQGVSIPKGAIIVSAKLSQFCLDYAANKLSLTYTGEASGNALPFQNTKFGLSSRPKTKASVSEQPGPWVKKSYNASQDLRDIVQEIVNRSDWQPGNALNIFANGQGSQSVRLVSTFDKSAAQAAKLEIVYRMQ